MYCIGSGVSRCLYLFERDERRLEEVWAFGSNRSMELGGRKEVAQIASAQRMKSVRDVHVVQASSSRLRKETQSQYHEMNKYIMYIISYMKDIYICDSICTNQEPICIYIYHILDHCKMRLVPMREVSSANSTSGQSHTLILGSNGEVCRAFQDL